MSRLSMLAPVLCLLASPAFADRVVLDQGRFLVELNWFNESLAGAMEARSLASNAAFFRAAGGDGLVVQIVDGRAVNGDFWLLSARIGDPRYTLEVTDLTTGERRSYSELDGAGGARDLSALPAGGRGSESWVNRGALAGGALRVQAKRPGSAEVIDLEQLAPRTAILRGVGSSAPDVVVSLLDGREIDGEWWVLSSAPAGEGWDLELAGREFHHAAGAADTQLLGAAAAGGTTVTVTLDVPRAVKKAIPVAGGVIVAQSANGTKFTLTVPAKALLSAQEITLTPIKSIARLPLKPGLVGGVEIGPVGLRLALTAALLIAPTAPVALAQETSFGYRAYGAQFFLYPARLTGKPVVLPVLHAGGYGLARGSAAEQATQLGRLPPRAEDQFDQKLWNLHAQRRRLLSEPAGELAVPAVLPAVAQAGVDLPAFYRGVYNGELHKLLAEIAGSCAGRKKWGSYAENFIAKAIADGVAGALAAQMAELRIALNTGTAACYNEAGRDCVVEKEGAAAVPMLVYWRQLEAAGALPLVDAAKLEACLKFELEFDVLLDHDAHNPPPAWNNGAHHRIDTKTPVRWKRPFAFGEGLVSGTPHTYSEATWTAARHQGIPPITCDFTETGVRRPSQLQVYEMWLLDVNQFEDSPPRPRVEIVYTPGKPAMEVQQTCPPGGPTKTFMELFPWAFLMLHAFELDADAPFLPPAFVYRAENWSVTQGGLYATKAYSGRATGPGPTASEVTKLYLFHRPAG